MTDSGLDLDKSMPGIVRLVGELDLRTAKELVDSLAELNGGTTDVDMAGVSFMDSSGTRAMLHLARQHPGLRFAHPSPSVSRLLEIAGLDDLVTETLEGQTE
jgi:anti-anti-sigma factor